MSSDEDPILVELTATLAEFLIYNCNSNIEMGMTLLEPPNEGAIALQGEEADQITQLVEYFKSIKEAVEKASS